MLDNISDNLSCLSISFSLSYLFKEYTVAICHSSTMEEEDKNLFKITHVA